ncbi:MAG: accessory factor UbiK family protein [Janthinobacterium lividum]
MPQTRGRIFDDFASLMTNAAGVANGVKREAETAVRTQVERILSGMNVVTREEFEAVRDMAALAREENEELRRRIVVLEARHGSEPKPATVVV